MRDYYDQSYIDALERGDTWISQAWSGDIFQANASGHPELRFVVPDEGVMHWTDTMMIPMNAANPVSAMAWMNYYYQPRIAAMVADWVEYITPGAGRPGHPAEGRTPRWDAARSCSRRP